MRLLVGVDRRFRHLPCFQRRFRQRMFAALFAETTGELARAFLAEWLAHSASCMAAVIFTFNDLAATINTPGHDAGSFAANSFITRISVRRLSICPLSS